MQHSRFPTKGSIYLHSERISEMAFGSKLGPLCPSYLRALLTIAALGSWRCGNRMTTILMPPLLSFSSRGHYFVSPGLDHFTSS